MDRMRSRLIENKLQYNIVKYKKLELLGMIKKYAIVKNIIARNKLHPKEKKVSMPFVLIHKAGKKPCDIDYVKSEDNKKVSLFSTGDMTLHGNMQA